MDWLTLAAASASALFAGLVWWQARQRLGVRYEAATAGVDRNGNLPITITVTNRRDRPMVVEHISVRAPVGILAGPGGNRYGHVVPAGAPVESVLKVQENKHLKAEAEPEVFNMLLSREGGFDAFQAVSVWLHIRINLPVLSRQKKKVSVMIPERTR